MSEIERPDTAAVRGYLLALQESICSDLEREDGVARFRRDVFEGERGGLARPWVLDAGAVFERAGVSFSHSTGSRLPAAATERRPELAGLGFEALSVSLIVHPANPYVPTSHANFRFFVASNADAAPVWWFGGGFDLTPFYPFLDDVVHWHRTARAACEPFGSELYSLYKKACDEYFYLPHRKETRGVGGIFFDDLDEGGFARCFDFWRSVADHYLPAYLPIVARRKSQPHGEREREFQLVRRGRYVEFNLIYDRGTRYGLQSGGRIESILVSMPPLVRWHYDWQPEPGSPEAKLGEEFLKPRDWLGSEPE